MRDGKPPEATGAVLHGDLRRVLRGKTVLSWEQCWVRFVAEVKCFGGAAGPALVARGVTDAHGRTQLCTAGSAHSSRTSPVSAPIPATCFVDPYLVGLFTLWITQLEIVSLRRQLTPRAPREYRGDGRPRCEPTRIFGAPHAAGPSQGWRTRYSSAGHADVGATRTIRKGDGALDAAR